MNHSATALNKKQQAIAKCQITIIRPSFLLLPLMEFEIQNIHKIRVILMQSKFPTLNLKNMTHVTRNESFDEAMSPIVKPHSFYGQRYLKERERER